MSPLTDVTTTMTYAQARKQFTEHAVRHAEVPTEHAVSLPMPTLRWSVPAFAGFACPAVRSPGTPPRLIAPDRWWAVHARTHKLVAYGLTSAVPFTADDLPRDAVVDRTGRSIPQVTEDLRMLDELMDVAAGPFLEGSQVERTARGDLLEILTVVVTPDALPWSRAIAPDFFDWLDA